METIAVYWESKIRTYGFHLLEGLCLCRIDLTSGDCARWGESLQALSELGPSFRLVWSQADLPDTIRFFLLCDEIHWGTVSTFLTRQAGIGLQPWTKHDTAVDVIYFQGPHFGDRYGILDFTHQALAPENVPVLATVCSVATIYLVLPTGWGGRARKLLVEAFDIPRPGRSARFAKNAG